MTNIYAHISDGDAPKSQHVTEVSFVDENGKHVDIGGGGAAEIHTDVTLAGTGTIKDALRLSGETNSKIAKALTLNENNVVDASNVSASDVSSVRVCKNTYGKLILMFFNKKGLSMEAVDGGAIYALTVPAIPALAAISTLDSSAELADVINKVNEILNAVKNAI